MELRGVKGLPCTGMKAPTEVKRVDGVKTYITGNRKDAVTETSPGFCLMGGGPEVDGAMKWMIEKSGGGDFVILRTNDSDGYNDYIYNELGGVDSVQTLIIDSREKANSCYVEEVIRNAEGVFLAGGNQWNYFRCWNDTKVEDALNHLAHDKKVPIGGTSAGCASIGGLFFSAENGTVTSSQALADPYNEKMTLRTDFLSFPGMKSIITDTHFRERDRMGRSGAFLARLIKDFYTDSPEAPALIAIDREAALTIDSDGHGKVWGAAGPDNEIEGQVYFLQADQSPQNCEEDSALTFNGDSINCYRVTGAPDGKESFKILEDGTPGEFSGGEGYPINITGGKFDKNPY